MFIVLNGQIRNKFYSHLVTLVSLMLLTGVKQSLEAKSKTKEVSKPFFFFFLNENNQTHSSNQNNVLQFFGKKFLSKHYLITYAGRYTGDCKKPLLSCFDGDIIYYLNKLNINFSNV